ncbi:MAG: YgiT-type zinc finger protein [Anaerolineae bacterium]
MTGETDFDETSLFDIEKLRDDVASGKRPLWITTHAQMEAFKDGGSCSVQVTGTLFFSVLSRSAGHFCTCSGHERKEKIMICSVCSSETNKNGLATQVFRRDGVTVTITGIPAVSICPSCGNAVLDWEIAQQVEDLISPLFQWAETHTLPKPVISITFPEISTLAA